MLNKENPLCIFCDAYPAQADGRACNFGSEISQTSREIPFVSVTVILTYRIQGEGYFV